MRAMRSRSVFKARVHNYKYLLKAQHVVKELHMSSRSRVSQDASKIQPESDVKAVKKIATPVSVALQGKDAASHSIVGPKFIKHFKSNQKDPYDNIPDVEVCFKVSTIADVNVVEHSFFCEFILMYDWLDESLELSEHAHDEKVVWEEHFFPSIELFNCVKQNIIGGASHPRVKGTSNRVTQTQRIAAVLRTQYDLRLYPFDHQYLEIQLKSRGVSRQKGGTVNVRLANPITWRGKKGHKLGDMVDWLAEWDIAKIDAAPDGKTHDRYRLQVCVLRDSTSSFWNLVLSLTCILALSFTAFGLAIDELADRESIVMTMLLATMTFKFVLSDHLPSVPYLTVMDTYVVKGQCTICVQGIVFCLLDLLDRYGDAYIESQFAAVKQISVIADVIFFVLLSLWQVKIHWDLYTLFKSTTIENFLADTNLRCVVKQRKPPAIHPSAKNLESAGDWQVYCTNQVYRPYPLPPKKGLYTGSVRRNARFET